MSLSFSKPGIAGDNRPRVDGAKYYDSPRACVVAPANCQTALSCNDLSYSATLRPMFSSIHAMIPSDADIANQTLKEESGFRFSTFSATDAVTLGLSLRKRFRGSSRHVKGKGMVISIQTIAGHTLFACTAGDLGHHSGEGDVSLDSWACLESMISVVKRTSHSSFYVEKGMSAMGKTAKQMGVDGEFAVRGGGQ